MLTMMDPLTDTEYMMETARTQACYVATFCVNARVVCFGSVYRGRMITNDLGVLADREWRMLDTRLKGLCRTGDIVVMPDHLHGLFGVQGPTNPIAPDWMNAYRVVRTYRMRLGQRLREQDRTLQDCSWIWFGPAIIDPVTNGWELHLWRKRMGDEERRWWFDPLRAR